MSLIQRIAVAVVSQVQASVLERVLDLSNQLAAERAISGELRTRLAVSQTNFEWLCARVNDLTLERAELYQRIGVIVPTPQITRIETPIDLHGLDDRYTPPAGKQAPDVGDLMAAARTLREKALHPAAASAIAGAEALSFEDMGDEAARDAGIARTETGELAYSR